VQEGIVRHVCAMRQSMSLAQELCNLLRTRVIHAYELEEKVRHCSKVQENGAAHGSDRLPLGRKTRKNQDWNSDDQRSDGQIKLQSRRTLNHDQELDRETEEEEEIKLQKSNVDL